MAEPKVPARFDTLAVIGNGIIGHGVAQVFAMAGKKVVLVGRAGDSLERARKRIRASLDDFVAHELLSAGQIEAVMRRITPTTRLEDAAVAELVIEAVTEDLALKRDLFGRLDRICPPPAVLAPSSGQPASALIDKVTTPERVVAAHFWYPPQLIPLVEICGGPQTAPEVVAFTAAAIRDAGKEPVIINREIAGFIGNRLQFAMLREAWALWASGAASADAIDAVVRNSFGRRVAITGPLESADVGGLATMYHFGRSLMPDLDRAPEPAEAVAKLVAEGANGLATKRGVHDWTRRDGDELLKARMAELFRWLKHDREKTR
jgi:3-hydroxybutyryl-CoA dehydrogenase